MMLDPALTKIRFTGRTDNSQLCLPGGRLEVGERVAATCLREVLEATGWEVRRSTRRKDGPRPLAALDTDAYLVQMAQQVGRILVHPVRARPLEFLLAVAAREEADA
jgi:8-oxo-dGTP pyrophosphatase MutT (NUDIX family)